MAQVTAAMFWDAQNIGSYQDYTVRGGEVELSDAEYSDVLDELYGNVQVCGMTYSAGAALEALDPVAFRCGKGDYESDLTSCMEDALGAEDDSELTFLQYDVSDITDEETN